MTSVIKNKNLSIFKQNKLLTFGILCVIL